MSAPADPRPDGRPDPTPAASPPGPDLARRRFFREFAAELVQTAATVVGTASAIQRSTAEAAAAILDPDRAALHLGLSEPPVSPGGPGGTSVPAATASGFRTAFRWEGEVLLMIDQRKLPFELVDHAARTPGEVAFAIREMVIRGAPAIGQVAAIGMAMAAESARALDRSARQRVVRAAATSLKLARPTAVNLGWAVDRMLARFNELADATDDGSEIADAMRAEAEAIVYEATEDHGRLAAYGAAVLPDRSDRPLHLLTHCNTGPLACGQFGTALGVVQVAHHEGRSIHVWVDETRPYLQGSRLTAWELAQAGVPHTLIPDVAAASLLASGRIDAVLVGADRIAANGDTANKVGTYGLAVLAARHGVPLYVCAPMTTVDPSTRDGGAIPIEERAADEVTRFRGIQIAPADTRVWNPAFDVTPAELIAGIVTDEGVLRPPYGPAIATALSANRVRRAAELAAVVAAVEAGTDSTIAQGDVLEQAVFAAEVAASDQAVAPDQVVAPAAAVASDQIAVAADAPERPGTGPRDPSGEAPPW
jgi:methylthioribose-1-phosphate isomerase